MTILTQFTGAANELAADVVATLNDALTRLGQLTTRVTTLEGGTGPTPEPSTSLTYVYGPADNAPDSGTINLQSTRQIIGRTWRAAAPLWKGVMGQFGDGGTAIGLSFRFNDTAGYFDYFPLIYVNVDARNVRVPYSGASPSATEPFTYARINADLSVGVYCATTQPSPAQPAGSNERLLGLVPKSIWEDAVFWGDQATADLVPGKLAQSNADRDVANGIYAARLGAVQ